MTIPMSGTTQWMFARAVQPVKNSPMGSRIDPGMMAAVWSASASTLLLEIGKRKKDDDVEKGTSTGEEDVPEDALDEHIQDVLSKRAKFRRMMAGVWSFLKTRKLSSSTCITGLVLK